MEALTREFMKVWSDEGHDMTTDFLDWLAQSLATLSAERDSLKAERDELRRRKDSMEKFYIPRMNLLQKYQQELPEPYRTAICDILANGSIRPSLRSPSSETEEAK